MKRTLKELKTTMALAFPMMAGQLSQMLLGLADTLMIGRVGTVELAAAAFVNVLFHIPIILGIAITAAVSVRVSHAHGANEHEEAGEAFRHGTILALLVGAVTGLAILGCIPFLDFFGQPEDVSAAAPPYLFWVTLSVIPMMPGMVIRGFAESKDHPWPVFWISMGGVLLNIVLNYLLIFGKLGFPELGLTGAGMATFVSRVLTLVWLWIYVRGSRTLAESCPEHWLAPIQRIQWTRLIKLALPIGGQIAMEFGMIAVTALLIGHFGAVQMAAHQIAITCAATTFMLPLGLSMALTIRVGHSIGAGAIERCRRIIIGAHGTGFLIMATAATIYLIFREDLAQFFSRDPEVIGLTASLLIITAVFQIFDSLQVISMGALRGMQDTRVPTWIVFISYWIITLPMGCVLAYTALPGALGFWTALAIGLAIAAIALTVRAGMNLSNGAGINTESA
jgi:MATE family multidrug resistance protein